MMTKLMSIFAVLLLTACSGGSGGDSGGGGTSGSVSSFLDPAATGSFTLTTLAINGTAVDEYSDTSVNGQISLAGLSGQFNSAGDQIDFENGNGAAAILTANTDYVALFNAQPQTTSPFLGVIGMPTDIAELPTGNVTYLGTSSARFAIVDGNTGATYVVTGDVEAQANFGDELLDLTFDNLDGTSVTGLATPVPVSDIGVLEIEDATLIDGSFSGGSADFTRGSNFATDLSLSAIVTLEGGVFGPEGDEIGGVLVVEDSTADLLFTGGFTAD